MMASRGGADRVELTFGGLPGRGEDGGWWPWTGRSPGRTRPTRSASSASGGAAALGTPPLTCTDDGTSASGDVAGPPDARRSAALPARPRPSSARPARKCGAPAASPPPRPSTVRRAAEPADPPDAQGGGAAQSRGGLRRIVGSSDDATLAPAPWDDTASRSPTSSSSTPSSVSAAGSGAGAWSAPARGIAVGAGAGRSPSPRAWAASRRAQSWKVGQTGKALDRQYASWCATARGAGSGSAKHRWRWSGLVERDSRSSSNATNGQAGAPSMLGSPRSVIAKLMPAGTTATAHAAPVADVVAT